MLRILYGSIIFCLLSCNSKLDNRESIGYIQGNQLISIKTIEIDSVFLNPLAFSGVGFFEISSDTILFYDKIYGTVSKFDSKGNYLGRSLGLGEGPEEVLSIMHAMERQDGSHVILEKIWAVNVYDRSWRKTKRKAINWSENASIKEMQNKPTGEMKGIYEIEYLSKPKLIRDNELVVPITTDHPKFNSYFTDQYYEDARVFGLLNIRTGIMERIFGFRPKIFLGKKYIPNFDFVHYDIHEQKIVATFEPDSLIYELNENGEILKTYGQSGIQMNTDYVVSQNFDEAEMAIRKDRIKYGYYTDLKYIPELNLLCRTYRKGSHSKYGGLQIYQSGSLITDLEVPVDIRIIGYLNGHLIADGIRDEVSDRLGFYKIKLVQ